MKTKTVIKNVILISLSLALVSGCTKESKNEFPGDTPDKVVLTFFQLLANGGKLSTREALLMVSDKYGAINPDSFRKWTENYTPDSKIEIINVKMPEKPNKDGYYIARVNLAINTPSLFGGSFKTLSKLNLILDKEDNAWKIDFLAQTIDEKDFRNEPAEARLN